MSFKPMFGTPLNRDHPYARGLVAAFLFNEGTGKYVWDATGNGNDGICTNMADPPTATSGWGPGPHGGALVGDGSNDFVSLGVNKIGPKINGAPGLSFIAYGSFRSLNANKYDNVLGMTWHAGNANALWVSVRGDGASAGKVLVGGRSKSTDSFQEQFGTSVLAANTHYQIGGSLDFANGQISVYVNGKRETLGAATFGSTSYVNSAGTYEDCLLGDATLLTRSWKGSASSIFLYPRVLLAEEFAYLSAFPYCMFEEEAFPAWMIGRAFKPAWARGANSLIHRMAA